MSYLTIIVPHKNSYESLVTLLKTIPDIIKVIVVDDKSDYETQQNLSELSFSNVDLIFNRSRESNAGYARNLGIDALEVDCEWVMFSDADDLMNKENLVVLLKQLRTEEVDVVLCGVDARMRSGEPSPRADYINNLLSQYPKNEERILFDWVGPIGKVIRKKVICESGLRFESRIASNDVVFSACLAALSPSTRLFEKNIYTIIQSATSMTATMNTEKAIARLEAIWSRNSIIRHSNSGVRLHYGLKFYQYIMLHGSLRDTLKYLPRELINVIYALYGNLKRSLTRR